MTATVQAAAGVQAVSSYSYALTPGNNGGTAGVFGFDRNSVTNPGAIGPISTLKNININAIRASTTSEDLLVRIDGSRPQNFWRMLMVQGTDGVWRRYLAADATFTNPTDTVWRWGSGSNPVWTSTAAPRGVIFFL